MIQSMTGFGKSQFEINNRKINIEVKSLNSKQLDISTRIPSSYREKEIEIRKEIAEKLVRGKVDVSIFVENLGDENMSAINEGIVKGYYRKLTKISKELNLPVDESILHVIMRLPDSVKAVYEDLDESEWLEIARNLRIAMDAVVGFRRQEGLSMQKDLQANILELLTGLKEIEPFEAQRIENIRKRLLESLENSKLSGNIDQNLFEAELIFYLEKLDINEEKVRLKTHCDYFMKTMQDEDLPGKKLGFIAQEIGREINTIGSKSNDSNIQRIVVNMKDCLEKIKEQVLNVL